MKKQHNQRWQTVLLATITTVMLLGMFQTTFAQTYNGAAERMVRQKIINDAILRQASRGRKNSGAKRYTARRPRRREVV